LPLPRIEDHDFAEQLLYDVENHIWYAPLPNGTLRAGFTSRAAALMGKAGIHAKAAQPRLREGPLVRHGGRRQMGRRRAKARC